MAGEEAQTFSWRRYYLKRIGPWLYNNQPLALGGGGQRYYDQNMLYEASRVTSDPPEQTGFTKEAFDKFNCMTR